MIRFYLLLTASLPVADQNSGTLFLHHSGIEDPACMGKDSARMAQILSITSKSAAFILRLTGKLVPSLSTTSPPSPRM